MIELSINRPYPFPTPSKEGASANFLSKNGNVLQINIGRLSHNERYAFKNGRIRAGFLHENGDILWLFRFYDKHGPVFTLDSPFDVRIIPDDMLALHDITNTRQRLVIDIHVIDNGILKVLRSVTMPPDLTVDFLAAAQDQYASKASNSAMQKWMQTDIETLYKTVKKYELGK